MLEMFGGFGDLGIFGDSLGPIIAEKEKKETKKKEPVKKVEKNKYKSPMRVVFDSIEAIDIKEDAEFTEDELLQKVAELSGQVIFQEQGKEFSINKLKDGLYLLRPRYGSKCEKGSAGRRILLQNLSEITSLVEPDEKGEISVDAVKSYIQEHYGMNCVLHLIGDTYIPVPCKNQKVDLGNISFPVKVTALTLFGEMLEVEEDDYNSFASEDQAAEEDNFLEGTEAEPEKYSEEVLGKVLKTYFPEYADDMDWTYIPEQNMLQVMHKSMNSNQNAAASTSAKKEEMYPTDAVISLVFTRIELSSVMFDGKKEVTKKELIKYIGKMYPEYSLERTEIQYDKKNKLIIPILKSGKRGAYSLEEDEEYRREESDLMNICVSKESADKYGCMNGTVYFNLPQIPFCILQKIIHFFWDVYVFQRTEALVQIYYDRNSGAYEMYVPYQEVTGASVEFERDSELELNPDKILVMEIHSHGKYSACWSNTDNHEELAHRLYAVVGDLSSFRYDNEHIRIRAATGGYFVQMELQKVFRYPKSIEEYHQDMNKVVMPCEYRNSYEKEEL